MIERDTGSSWFVTFVLWSLLWFGVIGLGYLLWVQAKG